MKSLAFESLMAISNIVLDFFHIRSGGQPLLSCTVLDLTTEDDEAIDISL
jgi:hypothetical protein